MPAEELSHMVGKHEKGALSSSLARYFNVMQWAKCEMKCSDLSSHQMLAYSLEDEEDDIDYTALEEQAQECL